MRPAKFKLESLGYETFDGFTKDEEWNGWECPYFNFSQAQKVLKQYNKLREIVGLKDLAFYDENSDAFFFPADNEDEPEMFAVTTEADQKYYPVGTYYWIWEESGS